MEEYQYKGITIKWYGSAYYATVDDKDINASSLAAIMRMIDIMQAMA